MTSVFIARNRKDIHPSWFNRISDLNRDGAVYESCEDILLDMVRIFGTGSARGARVYHWITKHKDAAPFESAYRMGGNSAVQTLVIAWAHEQLHHSITIHKRRERHR